jgi:mannose-6-phosphate isomerase-like protein (cupin superfamily)
LHPRVARPWGSYESIDADDGFQAKRLIIKPGASISLQRHRHRAEHWVVVRGQAEVTRDDEVFTLEVDQSAYIPCGAVHRLRNPGTEELHIVEVQSGDYLGEDDIERFEDIYGRC